MSRSTGRSALHRTLRVAFLSAFVLELTAALATALVAVEVGLRLLAGHLDYRTALLVLLLTPEAYLPLRTVGAQFHASTQGAAAAQCAFAILDTPVPAPAAPPRRPVSRAADLRRDVIALAEVTLCYPGRDRFALNRVSLIIAPGEHLTLTGPAGALPRGYDTPLGERGLRLSAGQRQKIAVARAFLRDAPLLLLDEPTAHLDPLSASQVQASLATLVAGRTAPGTGPRCSSPTTWTGSTRSTRSSSWSRERSPSGHPRRAGCRRRQLRRDAGRPGRRAGSPAMTCPPPAARGQS